MEDIEKQNIEFKEIWKEDYLKWICGFANAQGGKIYIGKNDDGVVLGVTNAKKLLEDIPNKVKDILGIIVDVNLHTYNDKEYIEIKVNKSNYPINYKGEYHYRSGSTKQVLKGDALNQFLLDKIGESWDGIVIENLTSDDFYINSFDIFRNQAILSKRMDEKDLKMTNKQLLDSLGLIKDNKLKRAAMMSFYQNPEKFINGAYIKIAYFETNSDIGYMDEIHGSLIEQAYRSIDLIFTKYLKAHISYDGVTRVETYPYPKAAIREAVYNAIVHKNYMKQIPIQISVHKDMLYIGNDCVLPTGWTSETLMSENRSRPFNPNIANVFFRAGFIESKGLGIEKICKACENHGIPNPEYIIYPGDIMVKFTAKNIDKEVSTDTNTDRSTDINTDTSTDDKELDIDLKAKKLLNYLKERPNTTQKELANYFQVTTRTIERQIKILKDNKKLVRVGNNRKGYWVVLN